MERAIEVFLGLFVAAVVAMGVSGCGCSQIDEGHRGVQTTWGKVLPEPVKPGLAWYNPLTDNMIEIDVREQKLTGVEGCFTRDTQTVQVGYTVTFYPKPENVAALYSQFGTTWEEKIIVAPVQTSIKDVIGQFIADDLVSKREIARQTALKDLVENLDKRGVIVTRLDFTGLDFNAEYKHAVEAKVVAVQRAAEAKNKTVEVRENAEQTVLTAKAAAEAMRIKSQALSQNKGLVQYEAVQKWDGVLPVNMYGSSPLPFISLTPAVARGKGSDE